MFGGYATDFDVAYQEAWPRDAGYRLRRNLYQVLNHLGLFGTAEIMVKRNSSLIDC